MLDFWQILALVGMSSGLTMAAVFLGAFLVFRTKMAQLGVSLLPTKSQDDVDHYTDPDIFGLGSVDDLEKDLSPAARRYREQREETPSGVDSAIRGIG